MYMFACFWSLQTQLGPSEIASQSHSSKIEPNHFVFACAPRIGSGALALPMSGMVPRQGNKRSNRNTQPVATGVAEATKGDAKPQGKEAAPPSQGPAVPPEAETSQEAAPSQAQAETSASAEPSGAQAAEQPSAENGSTPKKATSKKPGRASPGSVHSAPAMPPRDKGKGKGQSNPPAPGTFPQPSLPLPWRQDPYGNWWYFDGYNWWMGYRTSSGGHSGQQPTGASQTSSGWTKLTGGTWMHPDGTIYGQPSQEPVSAASGKKTTPKKEEKPEESGGREKKKDKQPGKKGDKQEPKKTKPKDEPPDGDDDPDWGGDDDGGDGDSDYTYEYEEEGGEEEFAEEDQSLVVTPRSERPSVRRQGSVPKAKAAPRPEPKAKAKAKAGNRPRQEVPPERSPRDRTGSAATLSAAASDLSSIRTESVRELLRNRSSDGDRSRPNIGNVKLETFRGDRNHYKDWIKIIQAQRRLYQLRDGELAVLIFLSCEGEARQVLNQLEVDDMQSEGGLGRMLRLLDDAFGSKADERFEERQGAYLGYKRLPGQSIAAYVATLKRLREEYLKEDTGTTISDKAFAQRLLQRAGLTRRERYDVFCVSGALMCTRRSTAAAAELAATSRKEPQPRQRPDGLSKRRGTPTREVIAASRRSQPGMPMSRTMTTRWKKIPSTRMTMRTSRTKTLRWRHWWRKARCQKRRNGPKRMRIWRPWMSRRSQKRSPQDGVPSSAQPMLARAGGSRRRAKVQEKAEGTAALQRIARGTVPVPAAERRATGEGTRCAGMCNRARTQFTRRRVAATTPAAARVERSKRRRRLRRCDDARQRPGVASRRSRRSHPLSVHRWSADHMWRYRWRLPEMHLRHGGSTTRSRSPR